ncbi:MAG TPA: hypothetical protein VGN69_04210 [Solirubrobacteraceae bacterium]|jgi:hypothetical protein|nr:hypothetical protein [Solirubrobacteraceae bacterium]
MTDVASSTSSLGAPAPAHPLRRIETVALVLLAVLLGAAVIDDVVRQVGIDKRILLDKRTYRREFPTAVTKHIFVNPGKRDTLDIACAHLPGATDRGCLMLTGPSQRVTTRNVVGSYRLPRRHPDKYRYRYRCAGLALERGLCPHGAAPR